MTNTRQLRFGMVGSDILLQTLIAEQSRLIDDILDPENFLPNQWLRHLLHVVQEMLREVTISNWILKRQSDGLQTVDTNMSELQIRNQYIVRLEEEQERRTAERIARAQDQKRHDLITAMHRHQKDLLDLGVCTEIKYSNGKESSGSDDQQVS